MNTSASTAPLVEHLETLFKDKAADYENVDAIIGLRHTESASDDAEEHDRTLRTLSGLIANSNVGGFIAIDGVEAGDLTNGELIHWMRDNGVAVDSIPHYQLSASNSFEEDVARSSATILNYWQRSTHNAAARNQFATSALAYSVVPLMHSLACGNVLSGAIGREVIRYGGIANLTETSELSGAEDYTLSSIANQEIATRFLSMLDRFKTYLGWHGGKVDKNPSEGNLLGGLYNITLKSLGAAVKRDPNIPIANIIEYGERMSAPGFYFMDGMGGDIASYTGQAAAGCNIVLFVTGRGSPTNSSVVPTIKIVNTTVRYKMMEGDIDINAGEYLDGKSMEQLTEESLQQVIDIASGTRTKGEKRSQNIDLLWRRKFFHTKPDFKAESIPTRFNGQPHACKAAETTPLPLTFSGRQTALGILPQEKVGLIIPTVGCALATAQQAVTKMNQSQWVTSGRVSRFAVLANTEGCGVTTGAEVLNFLLSFANHPQVEACLFLSLGCEMVSPGFIKSTMRGEDVGFPEITDAAKASKLDPEKFGWITIQETGGTEHTISAAESWFDQKLTTAIEPEHCRAMHNRCGSGLLAGDISHDAVNSVIEFARQVVAGGGSVVIPECSTQLLSVKLFKDLMKPSALRASDRPLGTTRQPEGDTSNRVEQVTGLGAATSMIINISDMRPITAHTLTPTLNITAADVPGDFDLHLKPRGTMATRNR